MDGRIVRRGIISSCHSNATAEIVKRFWSQAALYQAPDLAVNLSYYVTSLSFIAGPKNSVFFDTIVQ